MPPQQPDGLLDFLDDGLDFGAHGGPASAVSDGGEIRRACEYRNS
jgi:hypothetical protein